MDSTPCGKSYGSICCAPCAHPTVGYRKTSMIRSIGFSISSFLRNPSVSGLGGLVIGGFFLWLALRNVELEQVTATLRQVRPYWILVAVGFYALDLLMRTVRWRLLLSNIKILSLGSVWTALVVGYTVNHILPARLGELYHAHYTGRMYQLSRSATLASIVVERAMDGMVIVLCLIIGMLSVSTHEILRTLASLSVVLCIGVFISIAILNKKVAQIFVRWPKIKSRIDSFVEGLSGMQGQQLWRGLALS